ncbi:hypothetical protein EDC04DRAFT_2911205 [Pisolithus marmoratus]|nr:hypothetical protein EDC04DRAFT_2911205 [Pisolithus marmoratus]
MQACPAEACMEIGDTDDLKFNSNGGLDYRDSGQDVIGLPPPDEDDEDELKDAPLQTAVPPLDEALFQQQEPATANPEQQHLQ